MTTSCTNTNRSIKPHSVGLYIIVLSVILFSCQKELKIRTGIAEIRQVILCNFVPDDYMYVNISKSKNPDDFNPVEFLPDCRVDLYEDGLFRETMPFKLKDTLSGLGYYTSTFKLKQNKTYKIISEHASLGKAEATEYLPPYPAVINHVLLQHADSITPSKTGKFILAFQDSASAANFYLLNCYYRVLRPKIKENGDTTYVYDFFGNLSLSVPEIPNITSSNLLFFEDKFFDGQIRTLNIDFASTYNTVFKEILFIVEIANLGRNYYEWNKQQLGYETAYLNEGQNDRTNLKSNIINGYGHFSARSSRYLVNPVR
jgi:hypothetical protein